MDDGRLGLVDFGCCRELDDQEWAWIELGARALHDRGEAEEQLLRECTLMTEAELRNTERVQLIRDSLEWVWPPILSEQQPFDFADEEYMERGMRTVAEFVAKR